MTAADLIAALESATPAELARIQALAGIFAQSRLRLVPMGSLSPSGFVPLCEPDPPRPLGSPPIVR